MLPTIKDVARQAGVSTATVSRVLNGIDVVSEHTRLRVEEAISSLGYQYNALARSLKKRESGLLGHVVPSIAGAVSPALARAVEEQAQKSGYNVILCNSADSEDRERANISILLERRVDGIIFSAPMHADHVKAVEVRGVPVVVIERRTDNSDFRFVEPDNFAGAYEAVKYLIDLGHKRIAMIVGPSSAVISKHRMDGYLKALSDAGIKADPALMGEGKYTRASGYEAMQKLLSVRPRPMAVFASNDAMAVGAMQAAQHAGLSIPADISIVGFDDTFAEYSIPQLTSVHQPLHEIGTLAATIVVAQIKGEADGYPMKNILPCNLKIRESSGPAPKN